VLGRRAARGPADRNAPALATSAGCQNRKETSVTTRYPSTSSAPGDIPVGDASWWRSRRRLAAGAAALLAAGGVAAAATILSEPAGSLASAATANATGSVLGTGPSAGTLPAAPHAKAARRSLLARTDHATIELRRHGTWVTIEIDRGKVAAVSASAITLDRPDGQAVTLTITSSTVFHGVPNAAAVVVGRRATVVSEAGDAVRITQRQQPPPPPAAPGTAST